MCDNCETRECEHKCDKLADLIEKIWITRKTGGELISPPSIIFFNEVTIIIYYSIHMIKEELSHVHIEVSSGIQPSFEFTVMDNGAWIYSRIQQIMIKFNISFEDFYYKLSKILIETI